LASCDRTEVVTSHAAFGYLTSRYGLTMVAIAGLSPDVDPSPEHLAQLQTLIEAHGITTVFSETLGTKAYADTLAHDLDIQAAVLDPIEGLADDDPGQDYFSLMRSNLAALREANGCS
jgi:zinc transport system substrate-binding protein